MSLGSGGRTSCMGTSTVFLGERILDRVQDCELLVPEAGTSDPNALNTTTAIQSLCS